MKKIFAALLCVSLLLSGIAYCETITVDLETVSVEELETLIAQFEEKIVEIKASELAKYAPLDDAPVASDESLVGQSVQFPGRVSQVAEGIGSVQTLVSWHGYEEHPFIVTYVPSDTIPSIMPGDSIRVYGEVTGVTPINGTDTIAVTASIIESIQPKDLLAIQETAEEGYDALGDFSAKPYQWSTKYNNYAALVVKNNADVDKKIAINLVFKDESGNMVGVKKKEITVLDPGQTSIVVATNDTSFDSFDYEITGDTAKYYKGTNENLTSEVVAGDGKLIVSVSNVGMEASRFVEGYALFIKDNQVVYYDSAYFSGTDSEIKPGETVMKELKSYEEFDTYELYFDARADK